MITEVIDEHHRPVLPGMLGAKVLVTVLFSRTVPLIRYEMSDSVRLAAAGGRRRAHGSSRSCRPTRRGSLRPPCSAC